MNEITRIQFEEPAPERRAAQEAPAEVRASFLTILASDTNHVAVEVATAATLYGAKKLVDKVRGGGGGPPSDAGQAGGQEPCRTERGLSSPAPG